MFLIHRHSARVSPLVNVSAPPLPQNTVIGPDQASRLCLSLNIHSLYNCRELRESESWFVCWPSDNSNNDHPSSIAPLYQYLNITSWPDCSTPSKKSTNNQISKSSGCRPPPHIKRQWGTISIGKLGGDRNSIHQVQLTPSNTQALYRRFFCPVKVTSLKL